MTRRCSGHVCAGMFNESANDEARIQQEANIKSTTVCSKCTSMQGRIAMPEAMAGRLPEDASRRLLKTGTATVNVF